MEEDAHLNTHCIESNAMQLDYGLIHTYFSSTPSRHVSEHLLLLFYLLEIFPCENLFFKAQSETTSIHGKLELTFTPIWLLKAGKAGNVLGDRVLNCRPLPGKRRAKG